MSAFISVAASAGSGPPSVLSRFSIWVQPAAPGLPIGLLCEQ